MSAKDLWSDEAADIVDETASILPDVSSERGNGPVEVFHRTSVLSRVELDGRTGETAERFGREQGGALRWFDPRAKTGGFVAASGRGRRSLVACHDLMRGMAGHPLERCPWNENAAPGEDHDAHGAFPTPQALGRWLMNVSPKGLDHAWVEAGRTTETWMTAPSAVQRRTRGRAWAYWMPRSEETAHPIILAARSWAALVQMDPRSVWPDSNGRQVQGKPWPNDAPLVFSPESSAFLALLLARTAHHPSASPGAPVGPGWILTAGRTGMLFGSAADDAGFPAEERRLADGRRVVDRWGGPGQLRRGSFRDPPESTPVPLVVEPPLIDTPRRAVWIHRLEVHPAGRSWLMALHGRRFPDGPGFEPHWMRQRPQRLLEACLGGVGSARESHSGVTTPALVFDPLLLSRD